MNSKEPKRAKLVWDFLKKVASPIVIIAAIMLAVKEIPGVSDFLIWAFHQAGPNVQALLIIIAALGMVYFVIVYFIREERVSQLKSERDGLEQRLSSKEEELRKVEENNIRLAEVVVKEDIWKRQSIHAAPFVEREKRTARFLSVLNLKGGVGKTTLTANLAACLASMERPLRILLVDLDFQGTLSNMSVDPGILLANRGVSNTSAKLLTGSPEGFDSLAIAVNQTASAKIIVADDTLERADFQTQARFFLDPNKEVRFLFRALMHRREVAELFDLVLFDCPPRLTTATINALTCSDYVLIPTKLDERSFEAIPRTLSFLNNLKSIAQPKVIGVVANEVHYWRQSVLIKAHQGGLKKLTDLVKNPQYDPDMYVFEHCVRFDTAIGFQPEKGLIPAARPDVRSLFEGVARELRERIGK